MEGLDEQHAKASLRLIGDYTLDESICSYLNQTKGICGLLKTYLCYGGIDLKKCVLWILSNLICNGEQDLDFALQSGIFTHVGYAARCKDVAL